MADYAQQFDLDEPLRRSGELQKLGKTRRFRLAPDALEYSAGLKYGFTTRTIALGPGSEFGIGTSLRSHRWESPTSAEWRL